MAFYGRVLPSGPRGWQPDEAEAYAAFQRLQGSSETLSSFKRHSGPRSAGYGPPNGYGPADPYAQRASGPPQAPRGADYYAQRPPIPPQAPRNAFDRPGVPPSSRGHDFGYQARQQPRQADGYRPAYSDRADFEGREPPAKRFRPASFEPPRVTADTYRPHENGPIERQPYRAPEPRTSFPPQGIPYQSRRPPYQPHPDRYAHLMGTGADARQHYEMGRYPGQARAYDQSGSYYHHERSRTMSGGTQWQQYPLSRMPPSPRQPNGNWQNMANMPHFPDGNAPSAGHAPYAHLMPQYDRDRGPETPMNAHPYPSERVEEEAKLQDPGLVVHEGTRRDFEQAEELSPSDYRLDKRQRSISPTAPNDLQLAAYTASPTLSVEQTPPPPFVQQDFEVVLRSVADDPAAQRALSQLSVTPQSSGKLLDAPVKAVRATIIDPETHKADLWLHSQLRGELEKSFLAAAHRKTDHVERLYSEYRDRNDMWKKHCERLDKLQAAEAAALAAAQAKAEMAPLHTPTLPPLSARSSSRRGTGFFGDAVRSEAEFQELLASLEAEEMADPNLRATRTAATVPDLLLPGDTERALATLDLDSTLVVDPVTFFQLEPGREVEQWTEEEQTIFCKRFALHPKVFGKIAAGLPGRSTADCVRFYYHNKYRINFRSLLDKRAKRRNRGIRKGASSLLSNLVSNKVEDADEDPPDASAMTSYSSTMPMRDRHHSVSGGDGRAGLSRLSTSQKKAARFAPPLASVTADGDADESGGRPRVKSMPSPSTGLHAASEGLLPPLSLKTSFSKGNGPSLGYFDATSMSRHLEPGSVATALGDQDTDEEGKA